MEREKFGSRLGFILLSAGCAIGCGNVWKFPWMCGQYGGGAFLLIYLVCLFVLGIPVMAMEFSLGRASQASPVMMYKRLEKPKTKWHLHGYAALLGNVCLMAFYTVVCGWMIYYFVKFLSGANADIGFASMIAKPTVNVTFLAVAVVIAFGILCFRLQSGLERVTKYMMVVLLVLMIALAFHSCMLPGASKGLKFYLVPNITAINGEIIVGAMNQAFFTLSLGIGSMAIFGSYIDKDRTLLGESIYVVLLDTFVAVMAGLIIFPAFFTYDKMAEEPGPGLLFDTMAEVFNHMPGGRWWGALFFLFMVFAALSTVLAVCENIIACVREWTGWKRPLACLVCGLVVFVLALTTALGYSVFSGFVPFAPGSAWLDFWDFIVSTNLLPLGSLVIAVFCCNQRLGWGWENFKAEANAGKGLKIKDWMRPVFTFVVPIAIIVIYVYGLTTFPWR